MTDQPKPPTFRSKSQQALTHPVTLVAIIVLVVNDWALKALWQNDWTTGKLSDLAWVIFASPLLAFLLSFVVGRKPLGQRVAFVASYVGLPLLYLLFNTFVIVNEAILRMLTLGLVNVSGTSPDPTDSLVIPLGLAIALWVWFRRAETRSNAFKMLTQGLAWPRLNRSTLSYSVAVIAVVASLASSPPARDPGVYRVWLQGDGSLSVRGGSHIWTSSDGGFTWNEGGPLSDYPNQLKYTEIETPRGIYEISASGSEIVLTSDQGQHIAYDASFFNSPQNLRIQEMVTRNLQNRHLSEGPVALSYHPGTGNVVAAMGIQGALVGTPDGLWTPVAVGPYEPTDFSFSGQMLYLVRDWELLLIILALGVAFTAVVMTVTSHRQTSRRKTVLLGVIGLIGWVALPVIGSMLSLPLAAVPSLVPGVAIFPLLLVMAILAFFLVQRKAFEKDWVDACSDLAVILAAASILPAFIAPFSFSTNISWSGFSGIIPSQVFSITALSFGFLALALSLPRVKDFPYILVSLAAICFLSFFGFLVGIPEMGISLAKVIVLALAIIAALAVLVWRNKTVPVVTPPPGSGNST
ncbi:MAG: hypothetical protein OXE17_09415 [Chloroflexi bacterium]|nr:hypothetical protein [Chloroflexota bacterium]